MLHHGSQRKRKALFQDKKMSLSDRANLVSQLGDVEEEENR